jgi:uncharacterized protein (DUF2141 family)
MAITRTTISSSTRNKSSNLTLKRQKISTAIFSQAVLGLAALLLLHCARQGSPTGGIKDIEPAKVDTLASTPNYSLHFQEKEVNLRFNEWITLNNPAVELVVSPPTVKRPELTLKGKTATLRFDKAEQLRPNMTYTVNYGAAIKDLHEGNITQNLRFVFSTGDQLDTLSFDGVIADAFSGDAAENMSVLLYESQEDSVIRKERPLYIGKADKTGRFKLYNLRAGTYKAIALEDINQDLKWSGEAEKIAFLDTAVLVNTSNHSRLMRLKSFKNDPKQRIIDKNANRFGLVKVAFAKTPENIPLVPLEAVPGLKSISELVKDTIYFWYDIDVPVPWKLVAMGDTIPVSPLNRADFLKNNRITFGDAVTTTGKRDKSKSTGIKSSTVLADNALVFDFNMPWTEIDSSRWLLTGPDSARIALNSIEKSVLGPRSLELRADWAQDKQQLLMILPGGIRDYYGIANADTLRRQIQHQSDKQLGSIKLKLSDLKAESAYVVQVLNGNIVTAEQGFAVNSSEHELLFKQLPVANYSLRLIEDRNGNGKWDTGHYFERRQPERLANKKLEPLRANWELEAKISMDEAVSDRKKKG